MNIKANEASKIAKNAFRKRIALRVSDFYTSNFSLDYSINFRSMLALFG
jgi:hypothetical protein